MNKKAIKILTFLLNPVLILFLSCNNNNNITNCTEYKNERKVNILCIDTIKFYIDSTLVIANSTPLQYDSGKDILIIYDQYNHRMLFYSEILKEKTVLSSVVNFYVNTKIDFFTFINADSCYCYCNDNSSLFIYSIKKKKIIKKYNFFSDKRPSFEYEPSRPFATNCSPIVINNNLAYGIGYFVGENSKEQPLHRTIYSILDLKSGIIKTLIPYPKIYWNYNWGGSNYRITYSAYNPDNNSTVISLPASHKALEIDNTSLSVMPYDASSRKDFCIVPLDINKEDKNMDNRRFLFNYYLETPSYRNIIYDKYRNLYYRFLEIPITKQGKEYKQIDLICFDKSFNYITQVAGYGIKSEEHRIK
ncbi:hypothetical protein A9P82_04410 [Arachidicoccus ginsenosidimutans]|uniref:DUF4221 family protein n=1 Tax=Arachidicoccus sp. BS20 TaxID=1850526 RepID=UPI0007F15EB7|nr:DUF4221 family protein [Arachidicoccus sp. BS20]ANI88596.1 hypothetical protein A9P82_04410 [Arachidicoccus sp. BS20]